METTPDRSVADIFQDILSDLQTLIRAEILLVKAEVRDGARKGITAGKTLVVGVASALLGVLFVLLGLTWLLAIVVPLWVAMFVVAGVLLIVGATFVTKGRAELAGVDLTPHRALAQIKDLSWPKQPKK